MSEPEADDLERRVLVLAPTARDAAASRAILGANGMPAHACDSLGGICREAALGVGALLVTEEALISDREGLVRALLDGQPPWSDVPLIVLTPSGRENPRATRVYESFPNVTLVKRPVELSVFVSTVRAALRDRRRQYEVRAHLVDHERSEAALRENDRRKDEFLAMLAHELRNPLAAIANAAAVASRAEAADFIPGALAIIQRQSKNLSRLVADLLDVARISRGKVELRRETVDVAAAVGQAVQGVRPLVEQKGQELHVRIDPDSPRVDADPTRVEQVVGNLLTNAAKYTEHGGRVSLSVAREGDEAVIRVEDSGVGISPQMLPKVFDLFTQVDSTLDRSEGGLGIGLTLVKQLVEMHGGTVAAASEVGRGSVFTVRLPALESEAPEEPAGAPPRAGASRKVLVIDDNVDSARLMGAYLEMGGHQVRVAHDGVKGVEAAREFGPDVVLLDIGLPGLSGYDVARRLRRDPSCVAAFIVAVSGYTDEASRARGREAGFDFHLAKPADAAEVASLIARPPGGRGAPRPRPVAGPG